VIPSLEHVIKKRHHNRRRLRFLALVLALVAAISFTWGAVYTLLSDREWESLRGWVAFAAGVLVPAIPLWLVDERIARALVPLPRPECPRCGYNLTALERPECPECGLTLPDVMLSQRARE
jgi:hypothetical protein